MNTSLRTVPSFLGGGFMLACLLGLATFNGLAGDPPSSLQAPTGLPAFNLIPASAPTMVLEAVGAGTTDGTVVSINSPNGDVQQRWNLVSKGPNQYIIRPAYSTSLDLTVQDTTGTNGTGIILQTDSGQPTQIWSFVKNSNGTLSIVPQFNKQKGLDDFGGNDQAGAKQDLWDYDPTDPHLQWSVKGIAGAAVPADAQGSTSAVAPEASTPGNPAPSNIPQSTIKVFTYNDSKIFPGTTRNVAVLIPAQYDGTTPACVYVQQDGFNPKEQPVLDELMAAKDMPVTVCVFITPGTLRAPQGGTDDRRNRCYEYDGVSDNYVRCVTEEILPYVASTYNLKLSSSGNDRCIVGASSGGISAFNAAWLRPDAFSRVYACSGSFVAFRGGNDFPTQIRKFEAKPIRAYLTTGTHDMENCAGDWFLLDQEMDKALKFSGYDYFFKIGEGGHCVGYWDNLPDAMRFIWKGWPAPVTPGPSAPRVQDIIVPGSTWQPAAQGYQDARSPACNSKGEVFFVDVPANKIYRIGLDGQVKVFLDDAAHANGLAVGPKDEIYTVSTTTGNVMSYDDSGKGTTVASSVPGQYVVARPDGALYVTTPEAKPGDGSQILLVKDGKATPVDSGLKSATGLALRPDQWLLNVADGGSKWVYSYQIGADGTLSNKERFFHLYLSDWDDDAGPESVCYSKEDQLLVGTRSGVQACADDGPAQVVLPVPNNSRVVGVALGGPDMSTLFAFCGDKIWKRDVKIHAFGAFSPMTPVKPTPL